MPSSHSQGRVRRGHSHGSRRCASAQDARLGSLTWDSDGVSHDFGHAKAQRREGSARADGSAGSILTPAAWGRVWLWRRPQRRADQSPSSIAACAARPGSWFGRVNPWRTGGKDRRARATSASPPPSAGVMLRARRSVRSRRSFAPLRLCVIRCRGSNWPLEFACVTHSPLDWQPRSGERQECRFSWRSCPLGGSPLSGGWFRAGRPSALRRWSPSSGRSRRSWSSIRWADPQPPRRCGGTERAQLSPRTRPLNVSFT